MTAVGKNYARTSDTVNGALAILPTSHPLEEHMELYR